MIFLRNLLPLLWTAFPHHMISLCLLGSDVYFCSFLFPPTPAHHVQKLTDPLLSLSVAPPLSCWPLFNTNITCKYYFHKDQPQLFNHESSTESLPGHMWLVFLRPRPPKAFCCYFVLFVLKTGFLWLFGSSLCRPGCCWAHRIYLLLPPEFCDYRYVLPTPGILQWIFYSLHCPVLDLHIFSNFLLQEVSLMMAEQDTYL